MTPVVWANLALGLLFILAIVGIPYWITVKRPNHKPDHSEAHAYLAARNGAAAEPSAIPEQPAQPAQRAQPARPARMPMVATRPPGRPSRGTGPWHRRPARARRASDPAA